MKRSPMAPGSSRGSVRVHPRAPSAPSMTLEEELRGAVEAAVFAERLGPELARRAEREARAILLRRGLPRARVAAVLDGGAVILEVQLPDDTPRVARVVVVSTG